MEVVTAGVDEGAGGQMGLAKTSGADEGGSEIKVEAGADELKVKSKKREVKQK